VEAVHRHALAVLAEHPSDIDALLLAGQTSLLRGDNSAALSYYRAATAADSNNATAFLGLGAMALG
jgi:cytochrome c-type biogenesis protein CcmH/NrfG